MLPSYNMSLFAQGTLSIRNVQNKNNLYKRTITTFKYRLVSNTYLEDKAIFAFLENVYFSYQSEKKIVYASVVYG